MWLFTSVSHCCHGNQFIFTSTKSHHISSYIINFYIISHHFFAFLAGAAWPPPLAGFLAAGCAGFLGCWDPEEAAVLGADFVVAGADLAWAGLAAAADLPPSLAAPGKEKKRIRTFKIRN